ncbi:hypothetical protein B0H12DRAFT_1224650 [Mycena haematopus]|nr:hypothetical protein B0H12DRAFT_1224650 [Mycena haematopus]
MSEFEIGSGLPITTHWLSKRSSTITDVSDRRKTQTIASVAAPNDGGVKRRAVDENESQNGSGTRSRERGEVSSSNSSLPCISPTSNRPYSAGSYSPKLRNIGALASDPTVRGCSGSQTAPASPAWSWMFLNPPPSTVASSTSSATPSPHSARHPAGYNTTLTKNDRTEFNAAQTTMFHRQTASSSLSVTSAPLQRAQQVQNPWALSRDASTSSGPLSPLLARRAESAFSVARMFSSASSASPAPGVTPTSVVSPHLTYSGVDVEPSAPLATGALYSRPFGSRSHALPPESMTADVDAATLFCSSMHDHFCVNKFVPRERASDCTESADATARCAYAVQREPVFPHGPAAVIHSHANNPERRVDSATVHVVITPAPRSALVNSPAPALKPNRTTASSITSVHLALQLLGMDNEITQPAGALPLHSFGVRLGASHSEPMLTDVEALSHSTRCRLRNDEVMPLAESLLPHFRGPTFYSQVRSTHRQGFLASPAATLLLHVARIASAPTRVAAIRHRSRRRRIPLVRRCCILPARSHRVPHSSHATPIYHPRTVLRLLGTS